MNVNGSRPRAGAGLILIAPPRKEDRMTASAERINSKQAHQHLESDPKTMLVCAYDDEEKFEQNHLKGAISLEDFKWQAESLPRDQEIIFYCA
jgi:rhodanese-related sulfurtransferase